MRINKIRGKEERREKKKLKKKINRRHWSGRARCISCDPQRTRIMCTYLYPCVTFQRTSIPTYILRSYEYYPRILTFYIYIYKYIIVDTSVCIK